MFGSIEVECYESDSVGFEEETGQPLTANVTQATHSDVASQVVLNDDKGGVAKKT